MMRVFVGDGSKDGGGVSSGQDAVMRGRFDDGSSVVRDLGNRTRTRGQGRVRGILGGHYFYLSVGCPDVINAQTKRTQEVPRMVIL